MWPSNYSQILRDKFSTVFRCRYHHFYRLLTRIETKKKLIRDTEYEIRDQNKWTDNGDRYVMKFRQIQIVYEKKSKY